MNAIVMTLALLQMAAGVFVIATGASAAHEILAAVVFGLGSICFALSIIIGKIDDVLKERPA